MLIYQTDKGIPVNVSVIQLQSLATHERLHMRHTCPAIVQCTDHLYTDESISVIVQCTDESISVIVQCTDESLCAPHDPLPSGVQGGHGGGLKSMNRHSEIASRNPVFRLFILNAPCVTHVNDKYHAHNKKIQTIFTKTGYY